MNLPIFISCSCPINPHVTSGRLINVCSLFLTSNLLLGEDLSLSLLFQYGILCLCPCVLVILFLPSVNCLKLICFLLEIFFLPAPTWILDLHHFYLLFGLQSLI